MSIKQICEQLSYATSHIDETVKAKKAEGKKVIGVAPVFVPVELIHAAGMFPVGCWGGQAPLENAPQYLPSFACSVMQEITELACTGTYDNLDGMIISCACDTLKCTGQNLAKILKNTRMIYCRYPQHNTKAYAKEFFMQELKNTKQALEEISGTAITNEALYKSIEIYNNDRKALKKFSELVAEKPGVITNAERHEVIKSRLYMDIEKHTALVNELNAELEALEFNGFSGKKVFLGGIMSEPSAILDVMDELGMTVVGDELAQDTRQFDVLVPQGLDQLERLADQWAQTKNTVFILDLYKGRAKYICDRAKELGADGVIFLLMMFCDPDEYDVPFVKKACQEGGMPYLALDIQQNMQSVEQIRTRLQAFSEVIE